MEQNLYVHNQNQKNGRNDFIQDLRLPCCMEILCEIAPWLLLALLWVRVCNFTFQESRRIYGGFCFVG